MVPPHLTAPSVPEYRPDELWEYSEDGQDSPEYISVCRVERPPEIHISCQQPSAEVTEMLIEDTERQDAIYSRLLRCETRMLVALVS